jgi:hypothetical protein
MNTAHTRECDTALRVRSGPESASFRAFGETQHDLDTHFEMPRPVLVSALLASCATSSSHSVEHWQKQTLSCRTLALLQLVAQTRRNRVCTITLTCQQPECREPAFEASVPLSALEQLVAQSEQQPLHTRFRQPTGEDQIQWLTLPRTEMGVRAMARSLLTTRTGDEAWLSDAEAALSELDPLTAFSVTCSCPGCEVKHAHPIDLEGWALAHLQQRQAALIRIVHRLATAYRWTEADVLALPAWRRMAYLQHIEASQAKGGHW